MSRQIIFVTGYFGAPIKTQARKIADEKGLPLIFLDDRIEKRSGMSIKRICMTTGEHEYRNREHAELVDILVMDTFTMDTHIYDNGVVICCGDGTMLDPMSRNLMASHKIIVVGADSSPDELWEGAKSHDGTYHAFMYFGDEPMQRKSFNDLLSRQRAMYIDIV